LFEIGTNMACSRYALAVIVGEVDGVAQKMSKQVAQKMCVQL